MKALFKNQRNFGLFVKITAKKQKSVFIFRFLGSWKILMIDFKFFIIYLRKLNKFTGKWNVPAAPDAPQKPETLYYFIGLEDRTQGKLTSINQPVLTWGDETEVPLHKREACKIQKELLGQHLFLSFSETCFFFL